MAKIKKRPKSESVSIPVKKNDSLLLAILALSLLIIGAQTVATHMRNSIYRTHVTLWRDITKRSPDKRRAHENYGQALSTAGSIARKPAEAMQYYREALQQFKMVQALKDDGSVPLRDFYREIGVVYFRMGLLDEAITSWQTGLQYAPNDPSLLNNLSVALLQKGRFDEAAAQAQTALAMDPRMPQALNTMGQVYMAKNNYEKAIEFFLKALDSEPDEPARYWNVALAFSQVKKYDLALKYANQYLSMEADPAARHRASELIDFLRNAIKH